MFVTSATHRRVQEQRNEATRKAIKYQMEYLTLLREWNALVEEVNNGQRVRAVAPRNSTFTPEEIETLVSLCHPDKHNGSERANKMTARLLQLRKKS